MEVKEIRRIFEQHRGKLDEAEAKKNSLISEIKALQSDLVDHEQAQVIIKSVGLATQQQIQFHISDIVSMALEAVFPDPYKFSVEFIERKNKTECEINFKEGENFVDPMSESGVGATDVAAFALRTAAWSMNVPHSRSTIILDEPFKHLSDEYHESASQMIKEISEKMGIQFIIVTHSDVLASHADRVFNVSKRKKGKWKIAKIEVE